jgi:hypothetical protein
LLTHTTIKIVQVFENHSSLHTPTSPGRRAARIAGRTIAQSRGRAGHDLDHEGFSSDEGVSSNTTKILRDHGMVPV